MPVVIQVSLFFYFIVTLHKVIKNRINKICSLWEYLWFMAFVFATEVLHMCRMD